MDDSVKRVHYFTGQLLTAADFETEQHYFLERQRRHNRCLHGWGVVHGLKVTISKKGGPSGTVYVSPGCALDCIGDELIVAEALSLTLPGHGSQLYVSLLLVDRETDFVPVLAGNAGGEGGQIAPFRIEQLVELTLDPNDPCAAHEASRKGEENTPCGQRHAIPLRRLKWNKGGWKLGRSFEAPKVRC